MSRERNFINRKVFDALIGELNGIRVDSYKESETAYGDMSRLVVAWLARTSPDDLKALYNELGWGGNATVHPIHSAAKLWMEKYRAKQKEPEPPTLDSFMGSLNLTGKLGVICSWYYDSDPEDLIKSTNAAIRLTSGEEDLLDEHDLFLLWDALGVYGDRDDELEEMYHHVATLREALLADE